MAGITDLISREAMRTLESLVVRSRYVVEGFRAGMHASPLKGASALMAPFPSRSHDQRITKGRSPR